MSEERARGIPGERPRPGLRRAFFSLLCASLMAKAVAPGCAAGTDAQSRINALRVLVVTADRPYAAPGDEVRFSMEVHDGGETGRLLQITWIGGCFDPEGDIYYACFEDLAAGLSAAPAPGSEVTVAQGVNLKDFTLTIPEDIISRRPPPSAGPHYGIAYVFFLACAGVVKPVPPSEGAPASLPFGCFDEGGARLGAESFVPGYTQIYSFADGRQNTNPAIDAFLWEGAAAPEGEDPSVIPVVPSCPLTDDERRAGCTGEDPFEACQAYSIDVAIDPALAEVDPGVSSPDGSPLREIVWVNYYADKGDIDGDTSLVSGAVEGYHEEHGALWIPPAEPGIVSLWAVLRDSRGGASAVRRRVRVEER